jgi:hypothetical protein
VEYPDDEPDFPWWGWPIAGFVVIVILSWGMKTFFMANW